MGTMAGMVAPNFVDKTIWTGDNLDIMRGLNSETVDLIYLDPPFNSNKNYEAPVGSKAAGAAFKDTWTLSDLDVAWMGLIADEHPAIAYMLDAAGKAHGKGMQSYLTMMAVRLLEMHRVLKATGSIYLHCDPYASHYLKMLMDAVFGPGNFQNEIVWRRNESGAKGSQHAALSWGSNVDYLLFYTKGDRLTFNPKILRALDDEGVRRKFPRVDENSERYNTKLTAWRQPSMGERPNLCYDFNGIAPPYPSGWRLSKERMQEEYAKGNIIVVNGRLERRSYARDYQGVSPGNLWSDKELLLGAQSNERIGYPTQKPLALLERIIKASSNEGDMVLDPFCGCATACVAADKLGRQWVGIDISPKAVELVNERLRAPTPLGIGPMFHNRYVTVRTDIPRRTDIDAPIPYRQNKHVLYGQQEGQCGGCRIDFPFKVMEVDHVVPSSRGGSDHMDNLQLLCGHCNRTKGDRPQEYLMARLSEIGV